MIGLDLVAAALMASHAPGTIEPAGLDAALAKLAMEGKFSGAVVIRGATGVRFARGYSLADPFAGRLFTPETKIDGGSLAKPVTAAAILLLARDGKIDIDAPVRRYVAEYPFAATSVRHLLAHSAGLPDYDAFQPIAGKPTRIMLATLGATPMPIAFKPGTSFAYCNLCYDTLALIVERASGLSYQQYIDRNLFGPAKLRSSKVRPQRLADWHGRAIGYRREHNGAIKRNDSAEGEAFFGGGNISFTAADLARWGAAWWSPHLIAIRGQATRRAKIAGNRSGLSWGNWYCAENGNRCHYPGHHEGFHSYAYWDANRRISIAMVSNNTLAPALQQRLQRALVAFAEGRASAARRELAAAAPNHPATPGQYRLPDTATITLDPTGPGGLTVERNAIRYAAYRVGPAIHYVPGLDTYVAGTKAGRLQWLSLYEDLQLTPTAARKRSGAD